MGKKLIELKNVCFSYFNANGETEALKNINLAIEEGDFISIVGPSGCGKTTLLSIISGLLKAHSGEVLYYTYDEQGEQKVHTCAPKSFFGYMLQRDSLFEWRNTLKNALLPLEIQKIKTAENVWYVHQLFNKYGLGDFKKSMPRELSGGMRQRVALIRTLSLKPAVLLLDEPFSALDYQTRLDVAEDVLKIITHENKTAILVTHDIEDIM